MKNSQRGFVGMAIAILIALVLGTGGAYFYDKNVREKENALRLEDTALQQEASSDASIKNTETSDWKNYKNIKYGFQIDLPPHWIDVKIVENDKSIEFELPHLSGKLNRVFSINVFTKLEWAEAYKQELFPVSKIGESNSYIYGLGLGHDDTGYIGFPEVKPNEIYHGPYYEVQNLIIPTFKLIEVNKETLGWKTYKDDKSGFEFQYPGEITFGPLKTNFLTLTDGLEADIPSSYNLENSLQRSQKIYVGINSKMNKREWCSPPAAEAGSDWVGVKITPTNNIGEIFSAYRNVGDCAMDGCSVGNKYTVWHNNACYVVASFAIQANPEKYYSAQSDNYQNDPAYISAQNNGKKALNNINNLAEKIVATFRFTK